MGAPVFTEAELRRALKVAAEFSATVEINPRHGVIRIIMPDAQAGLSEINSFEGKNQCDEAFGL